MYRRVQGDLDLNLISNLIKEEVKDRGEKEINIKEELDDKMENSKRDESTQSSVHPENAIQDIFQWFGKMATEYTCKLNENASENFDMIGRDFKTLYSKVGNMILQGQDVVKMTAQEIRSKTSEEMYRTIKVNVILYRDVCKYVYQTNCVSLSILDEVKKRLVDEGFEVNYVIGEKSTSINIEW